jgi:hypothetical protein
LAITTPGAWNQQHGEGVAPDQHRRAGEQCGEGRGFAAQQRGLFFDGTSFVARPVFLRASLSGVNYTLSLPRT